MPATSTENADPAPVPRPIRVFLMDDHEIVREGVRRVLESADDIVVVGEAATADEALTRIPIVLPDVAVLDVRVPGGSGISVCREVRSTLDTKCLILTSYSDDEALFESIMAGASGYVLKKVRGNELTSAVRRVAAGESLLDPAITGRVLDRLRRPPETDERLEALTDQERRILELIADGRTNRQIAHEMHLAEKTIKNYVSRLLQKLGMDRRTEAAVFATKLAMNQPANGTADPA